MNKVASRLIIHGSQSIQFHSFCNSVPRMLPQYEDNSGNGSAVSNNQGENLNDSSIQRDKESTV
jgi:hypothetical protein